MGTNTPNPSGGLVLPFPDRRAQRREAERAASLSLLARLSAIEAAVIQRDRLRVAASVVPFSKAGRVAS